jgi:hypothetical protein
MLASSASAGGTALGWRRVRAHLVVRYVRGHSTTELELNNVGIGARYLRTSDLIENLAFAKADERWCARPPADAVYKREGELAVTIEGFTRSDGRSTVGIACWRGEGLLNNHVVKIVPRARIIDKRFAEYSHAAEPVLGLLKAAATGAISVSAGPALDAVSICFPDLPAQRSIASYLDAETSRIDSILVQRRRQLDLLRVRHAAVRDLTLASARAAEPRRLSHLLSAPISDGPHETPEFVADGIPFLSVDNVVNDSLSLDGCRRITGAAFAEYSRKSRPQRGDVLITKAASVGRVALVETDEPFGVWSPLAILRPAKSVVLPEYLRLVLLGSEAQAIMEIASNSNTQANLSMRDLAALRIRVPSLDEQARIVATLSAETMLSVKTSAALAAQVALLAERRHALITAAVTGQLDIPGVAA